MALTPASARLVSRIESCDRALLQQLVLQELQCPVCKDLALGSKVFPAYAMVMQHAAMWARDAGAREHRSLLDATEAALQSRQLRLIHSGVVPLAYPGEPSLPYRGTNWPPSDGDNWPPSDSVQPGYVVPEPPIPSSHRVSTLTDASSAASAALAHSAGKEGQHGEAVAERTGNGAGPVEGSGTETTPFSGYLAAVQKPPQPAEQKAPLAQAGALAWKPKGSVTATTARLASKLKSLDLELLQEVALHSTQCPVCSDLGLGDREFPRLAGVLQHAATWARDEGAVEHRGLLASTEKVLQSRRLRVGHDGVGPLQWPTQASIHFKGCNWPPSSGTQPGKPGSKPKDASLGAGTGVLGGASISGGSHPGSVPTAGHVAGITPTVSQAGSVQPPGPAFKWTLPSGLDPAVAKSGILLIRKLYRYSPEDLFTAAQTQTFFCPLCRKQGTSSTSTGAPSPSDPAPQVSKEYRWLPSLLQHCFDGKPGARYLSEHLWLAGEIDRLLADRGLKADQTGVYRGSAWGHNERKGFPLPSDPKLSGTAYNSSAHIPSLSSRDSHVPASGVSGVSDSSRLEAGPGSGWGADADAAQASGLARPEETWQGSQGFADSSIGTESADGVPGTEYAGAGPGSSAGGVMPLLGSLSGKLQEGIAGLVRFVEERETVQKQQRKLVSQAHIL